jgi:hypothetical protein
MFREMIARGVDPEMIALAIETAESASRPVECPVDTAAEKRRAYDRERKRLERLSGGSPVESPVDSDSALSILENSSEKKGKKERAKSSRGEKLPPDAKPTAEHYAQGLDLGFSPQWVDQQFEDMRIWARTNEHRAVARKSDWNLTFTGWLRRNAKDARGQSNGNGTSNHRADRSAGRATAREANQVAAMGGAALRYLQEGKPAGPEWAPSDGPGTADVYDLRKRAENGG